MAQRDRASMVQLHAQIFSCAVTAGVLGGVVNALIALLAYAVGLMDLLGVALHPQLEKAALYQKMVWGGIWGLSLMAPLHKLPLRWHTQALLLGCLPSLVQIFVVFPFTTPYGVGGWGLGPTMPLLVLLFNTVGWSFPALGWFTATGVQSGNGGGYEQVPGP